MVGTDTWAASHLGCLASHCSEPVTDTVQITWPPTQNKSMFPMGDVVGLSISNASQIQEWKV